MPNKTNCKRVLAFALALLMLITMLPTAVFAEELPLNVATSTDIAPIFTEMNLSETIAAEGFAYVQPVRPAKVYNMPDLPEDGHLYTLTDTHAVLLATEHIGSSVKVWFCVGADAAMRGYVAANDLSDACLSADQMASLTKDVDCREYTTDAGNMTLYFAAGEFNLNLVDETTVDNLPAEEPEPTPENEIGSEDDSDTPAVNNEAASEVAALPTSTVEVQLSALAGDFLQVTTDTRVFSEMDDTATDDAPGDRYLGVFTRNAIVRVEEARQDKAGRCWCLVTFLYGDDFADGHMKWTATDTAWILADETAKTDQTELTATDYAYPLGTPFMQPMSLSTTAMNGFSLKKASGSVGSFSVGDTAYGSSGRDSDYKQIAIVEGHGKVYATPHYLEGYTVYCLEHTLPGPGENISGGGQQPTGPYTIADWDGYMSNVGYSGAIYGEDTMHAIAWVLGHTYPFMVLDRSDSNNDTWSRVAGQFAIREVAKQMEGAQYVRDYWDMDNFYAASNNAPGVYLEYARWLAANAIAHVRRTGEIAVSNKSVSYANGSYYGTATFTTDANFMRINKSVGTLTGNTKGEDSSYYYLNSGDTVTICSADHSFAYSVESMMDDEAGFYVGIPSAAIQKILIPIESTPYPTNEVTVDFSVTFGAAVITKTDADTGAALADAAFEVVNAAGEVVGTATTGTDGTAAFENLQPGTYTIRETSAPTGYTLSAPNTQSLTVAAGQTAYATFANEKISGKIAVYKVDADSKETLAGAAFTITDASGHTVAALVTDAEGTAETDWLSYGTYIVTETAAPEHHVSSGEAVTVNITEHGKTYRINVENKATKGYIRITKTNSLDQTPIAGVTFDIFQNSQVIGSIVTDESGVALSEPLPKGLYTVSERDTPTGYVQEIVNLKVEVRSDETADLLVTNKPIQGKIRIEKSDSLTGDTIAGATFTITRLSGLPSYNGNGDIVAVVTTDANGVAETPMLTYGVYRVEETTVPEHYVDSGFSVDIAIHEEDMGTYLVDCENEPTKGWIQLVKVDALDRTPIAGVGFDIYSGGKLVSSMTTDENGVALSEPLPKDKYMVCEQEPPLGYTDDLVVLDAMVKSDETTYLSCTNQPIQGRIQIRKADALTKEALASAEFTVTRVSGLPSHNGSDDGETVAVITTDASGMAMTPLLTWGTYRIAETRVPEHYVDSAFSAEVTVSENQNVYTVDVENEPSKGWIRLTKTDRLNGNPIEGVQFDIYYADAYGEGLAGAMVTDENGMALSAPLRKGRYIVRERGEVAGYVFEEIELTATVKLDEITELTAINQPVQVQLKLCKRDADEYSGRTDDTPATRGDGVLTGAAFQVLAAEDITDRQGNLLFAREDVVVPALKTAGAEASVLTDSLWPGVYKIVEVTPPEGYQPAMDAIIIDTTGAAEQSAEALVTYEGVITNEILYGAQAIVKVLGSNGSTAEPTHAEPPEAGAEFKVYLKSAGSYENARDVERDYGCLKSWILIRLTPAAFAPLSISRWR